MVPTAPDANPRQFGDDELKALWDWNFTNHTPTKEAIAKIEGLRSAAKAMKDAFIDMVPAGRERSVALTHLEESLFYANAGIARNENLDVDDTPEEDKHLPQATTDSTDQPTNQDKETK